VYIGVYADTDTQDDNEAWKQLICQSQCECEIQIKNQCKLSYPDSVNNEQII